jgi:hypothetical protein
MNEILRIKPSGWSVVWRTKSISVRPPNRDRCKFDIRPSLVDDNNVTVCRFDRALNYWTSYTQCSAEAEALFAHLASLVDEIAT